MFSPVSEQKFYIWAAFSYVLVHFIFVVESPSVLSEDIPIWDVHNQLGNLFQVIKPHRNVGEKQKEEESGLLYWQEKMKFEETAVCF